MSTEVPQTFADLRLILNGKFLDNSESLHSASDPCCMPPFHPPCLSHAAVLQACGR